MGYNDIFNSFSLENHLLKKINNNLIEKKEHIEHKYNDLEKLLLEKQEKLKIVEQKYSSLLNYINKKTNLKDSISISIDKDFTLKAKSNEEGTIISTIDDLDKEVKNRKIYNLNKNNLNDLDAIYFFDKIKMAPQRSYSEIGIPDLNLAKKDNNNKKRGTPAKDKTTIGVINEKDE